ncbi:MAG: agmatinase family protein [Chthonomonas sp.]|nr:agmatinase family protein [Chthonomonas sp.]
MTLHRDAEWPRAGEWLASASATNPALTVVGVPFQRSISPGRADLAPAAIRDALLKYSTYHPDHHLDLRDLAALDAGDIAWTNDDDPSKEIAFALRKAAGTLVLLGGDNFITRPGVHGLGVPLEQVGLLTLDAHLDVRNFDAGLHNGNPIRALMDDGLPGENVVQLGLLPFANSREYWEYARGQGITSVTANTVREQGLAGCVQRTLDDFAARGLTVYVNLDVDVLDRAFSPGTPGARPGGFTPDEVAAAAFACGRCTAVRAMDLVEIDPNTDQNGLSCLAAARFFLEFATGVLARGEA